MSNSRSTLETILVDRLVPHPDNPRLVIRNDVVDAIASAIITAEGFQQEYALLVRRVRGNDEKDNGDKDEEAYEIVSGHHRLEAAKKAGLTEVPCWVKDLNDEEAFMELILANNQGELSPLERGIHANRAIEKSFGGGRGKKGGVSEYANQVEQKRTTLQFWMYGAAVYEKLATRVAPLTPEVGAEKIRHLSEIHKAPDSTWPTLVTHLIKSSWTVKETATHVAAVKTLCESVPTWWPLDIPALAELAITQPEKAESQKACIDKVVSTYESLNVVTIYSHEPTGETVLRDSGMITDDPRLKQREYRVLRAIPEEYDQQADFQGRVLAHKGIPSIGTIGTWQEDILTKTSRHKSDEDLYEPVMSDEEIAQRAQQIKAEKEARRKEEQARREAEALARIDASEKPWTLTDSQVVISCHAVITDPPYGILDQDWEPHDLEQFTREWAARWNKSNADVILIFWSQRFLYLGRQWFDDCLSNYEFQQTLVWHYRNNNSPQSRKGFKQTWEPIFFYRKKGSGREIGVGAGDWGEDLHDFDCHVAAVPQSNFNDAERKQHPAQKPVSVMRWLVNAVTSPGELVCDPFCGSGTTGIAAVQLKRRFHGIEIDPEFLELAERRIAAYGALVEDRAA